MSGMVEGLSSSLSFFLGETHLCGIDQRDGELYSHIVHIQSAGRKVAKTALLASLFFGVASMGSLGLGLWVWSIWLTPGCVACAALIGVIVNEAIQLHSSASSYLERLRSCTNRVEEISAPLGLTLEESLGFGVLRGRIDALPETEQLSYVERLEQTIAHLTEVSSLEATSGMREELRDRTIVISCLMGSAANGESFSDITE